MYSHPAYVDISHFRAPYKNAYFGHTETVPPAPNGVVEPLGPNGALPPGIEQLVEAKNGVYHWRPEAKKAAMDVLETMRTIFIGGATERVEVVPYTPQELAAMNADATARQTLMAINAKKWVQDRTGEGKVVFAPVWLLSPVPGRELAAIPASDKARVAEAASTPMVGILAEPSMLNLANIGMLAVGAVVLVGGAYLIFGRGRRRSMRMPAAFN